MSRRLVFHYARPDGIYDDWYLIPRNEEPVGPPQAGPFGVVWHVELDDDATAFTYQLQLQRPAGQEQSDQTSERVKKTDPTGNEDQTVPLEPGDSEVLYPSGYVWRKKAYTLPISWPDADHYAIREKLTRLTTDVESIRDAVTSVDSKVVDLDQKSDGLLDVAGGIGDGVGVLDQKSDRLLDIAGGIGDGVGVLDQKSDRLLDIAGGIGDGVGVLDQKSVALLTAAGDIGGNVGKLLAREGVIDFGGRAHDPGDVKDLAERARDVVTDVISGLETARTAFASELRMPPTPVDPRSPAPDSRGQAVQQIIESLSFAQQVADEQRGRLQTLVDDDAASSRQDLVALRAQLRTTADQIDRELLQVQWLTRSDPADLKLLKILGDEVRPELAQLRVLVAEVAP
jgi:hypothetical protein